MIWSSFTCCYRITWVWSLCSCATGWVFYRDGICGSSLPPSFCPLHFPAYKSYYYKIKRLILWWIRNCYHRHHRPLILLPNLHRLNPIHLIHHFNLWNLLRFWVYRLSILFSNYLLWTHALIQVQAKHLPPAHLCLQTPPYPSLLSSSSTSTALFEPSAVSHFQFGCTFQVHFPSSQCSCTCQHKPDTDPPIIAPIAHTPTWRQASLLSNFDIFFRPFQAKQISSSTSLISSSALAPCWTRISSFPACFHFAVALFVERNFKYMLGRSRCLLRSSLKGMSEPDFLLPSVQALWK